MPPFKFIIALFTTGWLAACSSTAPVPPFNDSFTTDISTNGTKFFTYTRQFRNKSSGSHAPADDKKADAAWRKAVQTKLDSSGYCRDGYLTLEDYEANGIARVRGECRDGASEEDRRSFPNRP